jgi:hypothetical protein
MRVDVGAEAPPSRRQMLLLSQLASETGRTFVMPATQAEASKIIGAYLTRKHGRSYKR